MTPKQLKAIREQADELREWVKVKGDFETWYLFFRKLPLLFDHIEELGRKADEMAEYYACWDEVEPLEHEAQEFLKWRKENKFFRPADFATAWCTPENEHKEMDVVLCEAIAKLANEKVSELVRRADELAEYYVDEGGEKASEFIQWRKENK